MIGRKIIIHFSGFVFLSFINFLILVITARFFGAAILGEISYFLGILGLIFSFSDFGFSRAHIKFIAEGKKTGEKTGVFILLKGFLLFIALLAALAYFQFYLRFQTSSYKTFAFLILLFNEFFGRLGSSILLTFEGLQMITIENMIFQFGKLTKLLTLIIFLFFMKDIIGLSLSYFLESLVILFLSSYFLKRFLPLSLNIKTFKKYFYYSLPFFVIYPLSYIQSNMDVVLIRKFWTASDVGFYSAAIGITAFLKSIYGVLITLLFPKMSQLFVKKQIKKIIEYVDLTIKYFLIIFFPVLLGFYIFRNEFIILILGKEFIESEAIFSFSLIGIFILMISSPFDHILYATGKHKILAPVSIISIILVFFLQLILIPKNLFSLNLFGLGGRGAILANVIVWFLSTIFEIYLVWRFFKIIPCFFKNFLKWLPIFILVILTLITDIVFIKILAWKLFLFLSFLISFYSLLRMTKILEKKDIKYFRNIINLKKLIKDGLGEFDE